ncbi:MAG: hypothetical protein QOE70_3729 [Chthoniobacter sp.]|jgi:hypothetical protein|nr:hypothetical protein [Chthoniobacter sp.]
MADLTPPAPAGSPGPWLGVASCGITFLLTVVGAGAGGWIGWLTSPPNPPRTSEYSGLNEIFETIFHLAGGLIGGGVLGLIAGVVISVILFRRGKAAARIEGNLPGD